MDKTYDLAKLWDRMWARRRRIGAMVIAATFVTAVVAFLLPPWYRAQATLMPPSEEESGFGFVNLLRGIAVPGIKIPTQATPADVFIAVLQSRRISDEVVTRFGLMRVYRKHFDEDAVKELRRHVKFKLTEAGTIELSVEDRDRKRAADMTNAYVTMLDRFNQEVRSTKGRRTRIFLERRLAETQTELALAEQRLSEYQSKHKAVALTPELSTAVETAARMYAQRTALQVQLGVIRSYTRGATDEEQQVTQQLDQLDQRLAALPATGLELARLLRDVKVQEQLFVLLRAQSEEARLTEVRDVATVEVLDAAVPPQHKVRPRRGVLIAGAFALGLAVGAAWAAFGDDQPDEPGVRSGASA